MAELTLRAKGGKIYYRIKAIKFKQLKKIIKLALQLIYQVPVITYEYIHHKNERRILVLFKPNAEWNKRMLKVPGVCWSKTYRGWTILDTSENRRKCNLPLTVAGSNYTTNLLLPLLHLTINLRR